MSRLYRWMVFLVVGGVVASCATGSQPTPSSQPSKRSAAAEKLRRQHARAAAEQQEKQAAMLVSKGHFAEAAAVYRRLLDRHAHAPRRCRWQEQILQAATIVGDRRSQLAEAVRLAGLCAASQSAREVFVELAFAWHREAQLMKNGDGFEATEQLYLSYLTVWPDGKHACDVAFYLAEVQYALERWKAAAQQYGRAVNGPCKKHAAVASYAAVLAWTRALERQQGAGKRDGTTTARARLSETERRLVEAFDAYLKLHPRSNERPQILYRKGRLYFEHARYQEAFSALQRVWTESPGHELALFAATLAVDCLTNLKDHDGLTRLIQQLRSIPELVSRLDRSSALKRLIDDRRPGTMN